MMSMEYRKTLLLFELMVFSALSWDSFPSAGPFYDGDTPLMAW